MSIKLKIIILIAIAAAIFASFKSCQRNKDEARRMTNNFYAATSEAKMYRTKDSANVLSIAVLTLRANELTKVNTELAEQAEKMGLQIKRLLSAAQAGTTTTYTPPVHWIDSIIIVEQKIDTIRCINYHDVWIDFVFCDTEHPEPLIVHRDKMIQLVHRVPRFQFWFVRIGTKGIRQDIMFANPNTDIEYTQFMNFTK